MLEHVLPYPSKKVQLELFHTQKPEQNEKPEQIENKSQV